MNKLGVALFLAVNIFLHWHKTHRLPICDDAMKADNVWMSELSHDNTFLQEANAILFVCVRMQLLHSHIIRTITLATQCKLLGMCSDARLVCVD